jgi:putative thioredoxin
MLADPLSSAPPADLIKDGTDAGFMKDVVEESRKQPVIVDFWAAWCGPCRQLTPALERAVAAAKGKVKLVKIDVDKQPAYAGQLRVQSIPTVYAFVDGKPVDGFQGAIPESQLKAFIDRLTSAAAPSDVDELIALAKESLGLGDLGGAAQAYAQALTLEPTNPRAIAGMARLYLDGGDVEQAQRILEMAPADSKDADLASVRAALELASGPVGETAALERRVAADPDDHEARYDLAAALAGAGRMEQAVDHLLESIARDRDWNDQAARKQLLKILEAAGPTSELARTGRRRLSAIWLS